ncbi:gastrokine-2 [Patagioenas fasciata]|uniref:Gastrokine-2 n=1 Tax=Patagioenas fasciata monilis TaxID=372326 RepID=A0A1V4KR25_PATFA|nr:gastrokine-2 [Patagioenas fasciata monilis]
MNGFAAAVVLLGVLWAPISALKGFSLLDPVNGYVTGTMTIDNGNHVVDVHVRSGVFSSDTIFDYSTGYVATRLFSRNACFIMKLDKDRIPELENLGRVAFERETMRTVYSPDNVWVEFQSGHSRLGNLEDWLRYGKPIERLCAGLPLYQLSNIQPPTNTSACANAGIPSILGINICENISGEGY